MGTPVFAKQRLYLSTDKKRLVPEGDDAAGTLYATPGDEIPESAIERFGLVDGKLPPAAKADAPGGAPTPAKKPAAGKGSRVRKAGENKEAKAPENKDTQGGETKGAASAAEGSGAAAGGDAGGASGTGGE